MVNTFNSYSLYTDIDQNLIKSLLRLLNCVIVGLDCRLITTQYMTYVHCIHMCASLHTQYGSCLISQYYSASLHTQYGSCLVSQYYSASLHTQYGSCLVSQYYSAISSHSVRQLPSQLVVQCKVHLQMLLLCFSAYNQGVNVCIYFGKSPWKHLMFYFRFLRRLESFIRTSVKQLHMAVSWTQRQTLWQPRSTIELVQHRKLLR